MAARALCLAVAVCALQATQASLDLSALTSAVQALESSAEATFNATVNKIASQVQQVESKLVSNLTTSIANVNTEIAQLVQAAEDDGISAESCGLDASGNLTQINAELPVSLAHCYLDYLDAFDYYLTNIKNDIAASYQAINDAVTASSECSLLDVVCQGKVLVNVTSVEKDKAADVAFQLADSSTAAINLVGTITVCDEEKSTQAVLDAYNVIPATKNCIAAKKAELEASSGSASN